MKKKIFTMMCAVFIAVAGVCGLAVPVMADCAGVDTSVINCESDEDGDAIMELLINAINILSGLIGVLAVAGVMISGYQYMMSSGEPAKMAKAKNRIVEIVIGLVVYAVMWAALNFLIPGGLF